LVTRAAVNHRACIELACILEAMARKPGNVHPGRSFADMTFYDLVKSALVTAPILARSAELGVGRAVLESVLRTRHVCTSNTNLGLILLLAPLCCAPSADRQAVEAVLDGLTLEDARLVYRAIRLAKPGGLGRVESQDIRREPTITLRDAMRLAADRDSIARQYANGFADVFETGVPSLLEAVNAAAGLEAAIVWCHLVWMAKCPDTLIARKRGSAESIRAAHMARDIVERHARGPKDRLLEEPMLTGLDAWLTESDHDRNPGASADLVAATLYVALRSQLLDIRVAWAPAVLGALR
jgi:triphosphoribosyl-dephospho-CoA synthase